MEYQETIKAAAKRMCEQLEAKGVHVKHTQMLEALATGFGLDSWRELKAVIDAPRAPVVPEVVVPPLGVNQRWMVDALYTENNQQYGDEFEGRTALEAGIAAKIERLTDFGNEIDIIEVRDQAGNCQLSPAFITDIQLQGNKHALTQLYEAAQSALMPTAEHALALRWLGAVLEEYKDSEMLEDLTDWSTLDKSQNWEKRNSAPISASTSLLPSAALSLLCDVVADHAGGVVAMETNNEDLAITVYQVQAICDFFEFLVDDASHSPLLGFGFK